MVYIMTPYNTPSPIGTQIAAFGHRLEAYRISRAIKQADLADRAGLSRSTVARIEAGKGGSLDSLLRLMRALDIEDRFLALIPDATRTPLDRTAGSGKQRQRVRGSREQTGEEAWTWGDDT